MKTRDRRIAEILSGEVQGIHRARITAPEPFLARWLNGAFQSPGDWLEVPLRIDLQLTAAPQHTYRLWASWMRAESLPISEIPVLSQWWQHFPREDQARPILLLARASGLRDAPAMWNPRFTSLLDQGTAFTPPDGRVLLLARAALPSGNEPLVTGDVRGLRNALRLYVASLSPLAGDLLPSGCLLLRSGHRQLTLSAGPRIRCLPKLPAANRQNIPLDAIKLSPGLFLECQLAGNLMWGASRSNAAASPVLRFVSATERADKTLQFRFGVLGSFCTEDQICLDKAIQRMLHAVASDETTPSLLARVRPELLARVERDGLLLTARKQPYALLAAAQTGAFLTMHEAASLPEPTVFGESMSAAHERPRQPGTSGFVSFWDQFSRDRDLQIVLRPGGSRPLAA